MATSLSGLTLYAANSGEDLSGKLFHFARVRTDGFIYQGDNAGTDIIGIIIEGGTLNNPTSVQCDGIGKVVLGSGLSAGAAVMSDSHGLAITASGITHGVLLESGSSGAVVKVRLQT